MKLYLLVMIALFNCSSLANSMNLNSVVLDVNLDPKEKQFDFPCLAESANIIFCGGDDISIQDSTCTKSLSYKNI